MARLSAALLLIVVASVSAQTQVLEWIPTTNWCNPEHWALGRIPGATDEVTFNSQYSNWNGGKGATILFKNCEVRKLQMLCQPQSHELC